MEQNPPRRMRWGDHREVAPAGELIPGSNGRNPTASSSANIAPCSTSISASWAERREGPNAAKGLHRRPVEKRECDDETDTQSRLNQNHVRSGTCEAITLSIRSDPSQVGIAELRNRIDAIRVAPDPSRKTFHGAGSLSAHRNFVQWLSLQHGSHQLYLV